jgi:hypothetical protein
MSDPAVSEERMGLILGMAVLLAVAVVGVRLLRERAVERARPGRSPATAIAVEDYGDIDVAVRLQACSCGGRFLVRGEGPLPHSERPLRVAHLECRQCERERRMYFDLSAVRH